MSFRKGIYLFIHLFNLLDVFEDYASTTTAAQNLLYTAAKKRKEVPNWWFLMISSFLNDVIFTLIWRCYRKLVLKILLANINT